MIYVFLCRICTSAQDQYIRLNSGCDMKMSIYGMYLTFLMSFYYIFSVENQEDLIVCLAYHLTFLVQFCLDARKQLV